MRPRLIFLGIVGSFLFVWFSGLGDFVIFPSEEMINILDRVPLPHRYELVSQRLRRSMDLYVERVFKAQESPETVCSDLRDQLEKLFSEVVFGEGIESEKGTRCSFNTTAPSGVAGMLAGKLSYRIQGYVVEAPARAVNGPTDDAQGRGASRLVLRILD